MSIVCITETVHNIDYFFFYRKYMGTLLEPSVCKERIKTLYFFNGFKLRSSFSAFLFGNSLIIHDENTKEITTVRVVWIPDLNLHRFLRYYDFVSSTFNDQFEKLYKNTRKSHSSGIQTPQSGLRKTRLHLIFQPTSWSLDILMKHSSSYKL